jgi:6-phosphogluconolactonase
MTEVVSFETTKELTASAAHDVAEILKRKIQENGKATLVLTGGTLGIQILGDLANQDLDLRKLHIYSGDERFVATDDPDRNELQSLQAWPELATADFVRFGTPDQGLEAAAQSMSAKFGKIYGPIEASSSIFDVVLLGMGPDGHIASLFPGKSHLIAWVVSEDDSPKPPAQRLSLSYQALNRSENVFFIASGVAKAAVAKCAIIDANCDLPAAKVKGQKLTRWYVDSEISREL